MSTELEIALVLGTAFLWITVTLTILSAIDRPERKARRQERRDFRTGRIEYRPVAMGSHPQGRTRHSRARRLHPH